MSVFFRKPMFIEQCIYTPRIKPDWESPKNYYWIVTEERYKDGIYCPNIALNPTDYKHKRIIGIPKDDKSKGFLLDSSLHAGQYNTVMKHIERGY